MNPLVTTYEQSLRLKELGVKFKLLMGFYSTEDKSFWHVNRQRLPGEQDGRLQAMDCRLLAELLPREVQHSHNQHSSYYLVIGYGLGAVEVAEGVYEDVQEPCVFYEDNDLDPKDETLCAIGGPTMAQAMAKALIFLIENGHVKVKKLNKQIHAIEEAYGLHQKATV